jgi:hypothetical protein
MDQKLNDNTQASQGRASPSSPSGVQIDQMGKFNSIVSDMALLDVSKADKLQSNASPGFEQLWTKMCPEAKDYVQRVKVVMHVLHRQWEKGKAKNLQLECPWACKLRANQPKRATPTAEFQQITAALRECSITEELRYFRSCPKTGENHYPRCFLCCWRDRRVQSDWMCEFYGCEPSHIVWRYRPGPKYEDASDSGGVEP